eukprot:gene28441-60003_t
MGAYVCRDSCASAAVYDLHAVLVHSGETHASGHYVAHVREGGVWTRYDDAHTRPTDAPQHIEPCML